MRWPAPVFGLGVYAAALVALAPASLIDSRLEQASGGRLRLAEAQGSLWAGTGWIAALQAQRVSVEAARVEALAAPGMVSATATLSRVRAQ